jgi:hypothetical protein
MGQESIMGWIKKVGAWLWKHKDKVAEVGIIIYDFIARRKKEKQDDVDTRTVSELPGTEDSQNSSGG